MRADRLISIIMLLQTHDRMTADRLSRQLEVSTRTIYRDILALNGAGIPVYTDRGPGGGIALLESYRTSLTGMSDEEVRALFMLNIPQALIDLGIREKLKSALLKLTVALPAGQQVVQARTQQRIYLDSTSWDEPREPSLYLGIVHQAVWQDKLIHLIYHGNFDTRVEFELEPLGLVAKMNSWYLVAKSKGFLKVLNTADILEVEILDRDFTRDPGFDLEVFWLEWCKISQDRHPVYIAHLNVAPSLFEKLHLYLGEAIKYDVINPNKTDARCWIEVMIYYGNFFEARGSILSFGNAAEVIEPVPLRISVIDFAHQIVDFYRQG